MPRIQLPSAVLIALGAAALFGASTPLAKLLMGALPAMLVAGLLYLGSGIGLIAARMIRDRGWCRPELSAHDWPWLIGAIVIGGAIGPTLLMVGLARASAADTSLLLNLESVFTALLAWLAFREHIGGRIVVGMLFIVAGSIALSWPSAAAAEESWLGGLAVAGACLCWAIDNNLTRQVSGSDALFVAGSKGMVAGSINIALALALGAGASLPPWHVTASTMLVGLFGYGISLVLFVHALRELGAARTGAYFAIAPFIGAAIAIVFFHESASTAFLAAAILMGIGVWIHLTERHVHEHAHDSLPHSHNHTHDEHHRHQHAFEWDEREAHGHEHNHAQIMHSHPHYPNIHHRHTHA